MDGQTLDAAFLQQLRRESEERWANYIPRDFNSGYTGLDWTPGTRWRGGLSPVEIESVERRYALEFPPDYRLFLGTLHTPDPLMVGARYEGSRRVPSAGRSLVDWSGDSADIERWLGWPLEGLLWSVEASNGWHPKWGPRPDTKVGREAALRAFAVASPRLVPIGTHKYLVGPSDQVDSPVLSIYGHDVIVYASNLMQFLLMACGLKADEGAGMDPDDVGKTIPFWADVIEDGLPS